MLALPLSLSLAVAIATAPVPAASPAPTDPPLKEIGRVRAATALCSSLLHHATDAIEIETAGDASFAQTASMLKTTDFDASQVAKARGQSTLREQYAAVRAQVVKAQGLMKEYKEEVKGATDPQQRAALVTFGNALDGAIHRQKVIADELGRFLAYVDSHEPVDASTHESQEVNAYAEQNVAHGPGDPFDQTNYKGPDANVPPTISTVAKTASEQMTGMLTALASDERDAADRIDPAFAGC